MRTLTLRAIDIGRHSVGMRFGVGELGFSTTYWYEDLDLHALAAAHGDEQLRRLLFHVAIFEAAKLCSLRPTHLDLGPHAKFWTPALAELWRAVLRGVWAQWRHDHDDPDYRAAVEQQRRLYDTTHRALFGRDYPGGQPAAGEHRQ